MAKLTSQQLQAMIQQAATAPFVPVNLEADELLWGSFWQFDVIAPGYTLPALELALLRASRLDENWPQAADPEQFLADLHQAVNHPQAGVWTINLAQEPWAVFAVEQVPRTMTVVWYSIASGYLYAGYRQTRSLAHFEEMVEQRQPAFTTIYDRPVTSPWISLALEHAALAPLDRAILQWRLAKG